MYWLAQIPLSPTSSSSDGPWPWMANALLDADSSNTIVLTLDNLVYIAIVMLLVILIFVLIACKCKPWRFFLSSRSLTSGYRSRTVATKADDIERPLVSEDSLSYASDGGGQQSEGAFSSLRVHEVTDTHGPQSTAPQLTHSDSFVLDIPDASEEALVNQTLKRPIAANQFTEDQKHDKKEDLQYKSRFGADTDRFAEFVPKYAANQRSTIRLEVISGPSCGLNYSMESTDTSKLPLTLGRISPSDILVKDSEVSGKHAMINWNSTKFKWELVDMGSLNGTLLNSQAVHHPRSGSRCWGDPVELESGDLITLGISSQISVEITCHTECKIPFGIGVASDPMALRRGARKLPMEDVCYYQWPLPGTDQFGLFGICDGHGGAGAATFASKILPQNISRILSDKLRLESVLSQCDASDVLREAFSQTETSMDHYYEGCTATVLLVWADDHENFFAQCANVGDSACVLNIDGMQINMTGDHRIASYSERLRFQSSGKPIKDGETRLFGLNLARVLGDKFLKEQDARFSSEPHISEVVRLHQASRGFAVLASDGFWDVVTSRKAVQLVHEEMEKNSTHPEFLAEKMASFLLSEAMNQRTKDNTSIIFLDFYPRARTSCRI